MTTKEQIPRGCARHPGRGLWGGDLLVFDSLSSTNQWALEHAGACEHGDVIRAIRQTSGRGRFERPWYSPEDRALTVSLVIRSDRIRAGAVSCLCQTAAVAVRETLEEYDIQAMLKWPNDVVVSGRKIAGVLAERHSPAPLIALGMGVNVNLTKSDLASILPAGSATSMRVETKRIWPVHDVCAALLGRLRQFIALVEEQSIPGLSGCWAAHDFLEGRAITLQTAQGPVTGRYAGMDDQGRIRLIQASGKEEFYWSGDVTVRKE